MDYMKKVFFTLVLTVLSTSIWAQANDPVVMKINGKDIKKSEFEYIYNKNNNEEAIDKRSLDEYITLFKDFKLKVAEAETQGMDTTAAFFKELNEYRSQLAKSYLETEKNDQLIVDSYKRANEWSEISIILLAYPQLGENKPFTVTPADTLALYKKALDVRSKALKKGAKFEDLVKEYTFDERSKEGDRPGYLGWFSGLKLAPVLEIALAQTPKGSISKPVRTPQGYYLFNVLNKKADPGEVNAAHILIKSASTDTDSIQAVAQAQVAEVLQKLKDGVDFGDLAKEYSQDPGSAAEGGNLSWFSFGQMVPEFNETIFAMKEIGEVSQAVKTQFGYHIIKLLGKRPSAPLDELRSQLETKLERSGSFNTLHQPGIDKLKAEYPYKVNTAAYKLLQNAANSLYPTDSLYLTQFENNQETLLTVAGQNISIAQFVEYLKSNPRSYFNLTTETLKEKFDSFEYQTLIDTEDKNLENKYPEFKNLVQEYHDGILLFEVSNKEVWDKASADTEGLEKFFEANKSNYTWDEPHWKGYIVWVKNAKLQKKIQKAIAKMPYEVAAKYLTDNYKNEADSLSQVKIEKGLFTKGQNPFVDEAFFNQGKAELPAGYTGFFLTGVSLPTLPENYTDVRGLVITDYQDYLEHEWLQQLNAKYPVVIYKELIEK
ncbi:MAG: Chaperone SurA [Candidatus Ordinivivax streblomastigis]|uniref:Chaperone SurA n=1 Tax=Candidatus Ordinivivax streblomastigis TaxID=2540710 RepID=A0A5M8P0M6_9BACT|nr:MAG: Chaperone SurA [Candidatus Ordinivivax streblomastigis]